MCGIILTYGIKDKNPIDSLDKIYHRGPFNRGSYHADDAFVGMVQLPMKSTVEDVLPVRKGSFIASYNGEIYDKAAHNLSEEVAIALDGVQKNKAINGMFALAAYDEKTKKIILARDEFGIKPLYYYINNEKRIFIACSEIQPILALIGKTSVNTKTISEIMTLGTQAGEDTAFFGVKLLEPGGIIELDTYSFRLSRRRLLPFLPKTNELDALMTESVLACSKDGFREASLLISDGLDSNLLRTYLPGDMKKYNVVVDGNDLGVNNTHYTQLKQAHLDEHNFESHMEKAVESYAQPCRMSSILMYQALSELIGKDKNHLVLAGEGADEFFWGYPRYLLLDDAGSDQLNVSSLFFQDTERSLLLLSDKSNKDHVRELIHQLDHMNMERLDAIDFLDRRFSLEPLLRRADHILMRNTIETRMPYLHFGIPVLGRMLGEKRVKNSVSKIDLLELMRKRNKDYLEKKKLHFRAPLHRWYQNKLFSDLFSESDVEILNLCGVSVSALKQAFQEGLTSQIFTAKTIVVWYEKFKSYIQ